MPEFINIASHFDDTQLYDGYTNTPLYMGQFGTFDEAARDGTTSKRRTLSLRPSYVIPTRRTMKVLQDKWIVGDGTTDPFDNKAVRATYWLKRVTDTCQVLTPAQACNSIAGTDLLIHKVYLRDTVNPVTDSQYDGFYNVFCNLAEMPAKGTYVKIGANYMRVRASHRDINGMGLAECDELDTGTLVTVSLPDTNTLDPVTETYSGTATTVPGLLFDRYKSYYLANQSAPLVLAGDMTLMVVSTKPIGQFLTINSVKWQVVAKNADLDAWNLHIRRR